MKCLQVAKEGDDEMRFIHTADWHIGKLFGGRYQTADQAYVLAELVRAVKKLAVDAVVIAGDIYDRSVPPAEAVTLFDQIVSEIHAAGANLLFISGNHDGGRRLDCYSDVLGSAGIYIRARLTEDLTPVVLEKNGERVAFSLVPYLDPVEVQSIFALERRLTFDAAAKVVMNKARAALPVGVPSVAVFHGFIAGGRKTDSVRELSVGGSEMISIDTFDGYDYVALGHLHGPQHAGRDTMRYSGSPLCYSFDEVQQKKGFELVDIAPDGTVSHAFYALTPRHPVRVVEGFLEDLRQGKDTGAKDDYVAIRLQDETRQLAAREKLSEVYENIFEITYPRIRYAAAKDAAGQKACEQLSDLDKFADFFQQVKGKAMTETERGFVSEAIDEMLREERGETDGRETL